MVYARVINGLPKFAQPILDLIADYTGWKVTLIAGGPEPADNGRLNMISMHSGTTSGTVEMNFGRSERGPYKKYVVPVFAHFLKKCYTVDDCRAAVLPEEHESLADMLKTDMSNWDVHTTDDYVRLSGPATAVPPSTSSRAATPRRPLRDSQDKVGGTSGEPAPYKVPDKIGPPIHAQKTAGKSSTNSQRFLASSRDVNPASSTLSQPLSSAQPPVISRVSPPPSAPPRDTSPVQSRAPSPAPSRAPSPAPSHAPSPAPSRAPSPAPSHAPSPVPFRMPPPMQYNSHVIDQSAMPLDETQPSKSTSKHVRDPDPEDDDLRRRIRLRLSVMQNEQAEALIPRTTTNAVSSANEEPATSNTDAENPTTSLMESPLSIPPLSPDWFKQAASMMLSEDLGRAWSNLLASWIQFEGVSQYTENGALGTKGRPPLVADWIRYARSPKYRPKKLKISTIQQMFWTWWRGLQPEWRADDGSGVLPRTDGDLTAIRKPGKNGLLSVLATLFYWGLAIQNQEACRDEKDWIDAVDDVNWIIRGLLSSSRNADADPSV